MPLAAQGYYFFSLITPRTLRAAGHAASYFIEILRDNTATTVTTMLMMAASAAVVRFAIFSFCSIFAYEDYYYAVSPIRDATPRRYYIFFPPRRLMRLTITPEYAAYFRRNRLFAS